MSPTGLEQVLTAVNRAVVRRELLQRPLRILARTALRRHQITPGAATVVIVNWNSYRYLETNHGAGQPVTPNRARVGRVIIRAAGLGLSAVVVGQHFVSPPLIDRHGEPS